MVDSWQIEGADGQPILGNVHRPDGPAPGVILIAHGFKGYKDYGMFPAVATACAAAGLIAHRFNFSHSGMTEELDTFARPDLFERDTWNRQVHDLGAVAAAVRDGTLAGSGLPQVWFGHSRGGVTVLLAAGRRADDTAAVQPHGLVTAAAPSRCNSLPPEQQAELLERGWLESPSARTGQRLRVGRAALQEQLDDPASHDVVSLVGRIRRPILVVHGEVDPTVPAEAAAILGDAATEARVVVVPGGDHVFNTPNPMPPDADPSPQLAALLRETTSFAAACCCG
ncbi:MAG: alpha/beta hydrolase [Planctomycetota bacterium]|jgi:dienelactone hydrolase